jgi:hypothetical protein
MPQQWLKDPLRYGIFFYGGTPGRLDKRLYEPHNTTLPYQYNARCVGGLFSDRRDNKTWPLPLKNKADKAQRLPEKTCLDLPYLDLPYLEPTLPEANLT